MSTTNRAASVSSRRVPEVSVRRAGASGFAEPVILGQLLAQPAQMHADNGFLPWVVTGGLAKDVEPDGVFLELLRVARKGFVGQVGEQIAMELGSRDTVDSLW